MQIAVSHMPEEGNVRAWKTGKKFGFAGGCEFVENAYRKAHVEIDQRRQPIEGRSLAHRPEAFAFLFRLGDHRVGDDALLQRRTQESFESFGIALIPSRLLLNDDGEGVIGLEKAKAQPLRIEGEKARPHGLEGGQAGKFPPGKVEKPEHRLIALQSTERGLAATGKRLQLENRARDDAERAF